MSALRWKFVRIYTCVQTLLIELFYFNGMNHLPKLLSALLLITCVAHQAAHAQQPDTEADYKRLYFLNIQYIQSWVRSDTATYNHLLWGDDFVHQSGSTGLLFPKKEIGIEFGKPRFETIDYFYADATVIRFIAPHAALVYSMPPFRAKGDSTEYVTQYNDIYVKRNGVWTCVSASIVPVSPPVAPGPLRTVPAPVRLYSYLDGMPDDKIQLEKLNQQRVEAFVNPSPASAELLLSPDFVQLAENGVRYERIDVIRQLQAKARKTKTRESYTTKNVFVRFVADGVALIHGSIIRNTPQGDFGIQYTDVYVKRNNNWICVANNNTPIVN